MIRSTASATDPSQMFPDAPFSDELTKSTNTIALQRAGGSPSDLEHVFCNNLFIPVVTMKETEGGIDEQSIYLNNVEKKGHCFGADAIINLKDSMDERPLSDGMLSMLVADAPGSRTVVIVQRDQG